MQDRSRFSATLREAVTQGDGDRITLQTLVEGMRSQAAASLMLLFALPNTLPSIPGTSAVTGLPLVYVTLCMMLGRPLILPRLLGERSLSRRGLQAGIDRIMPGLIRIERLLRPRWSFLTTGAAQRGMGALCLFLSVLIMLPIPFANILPALSLIIIGLGLLESDGAFALGGVAMAVTSVAIVLVIYGSLIMGALALL